MNKINILRTSIFPGQEIISGVTQKNVRYFGGKGITFSNIGARNFTDSEVAESIQMLADAINIDAGKIIFQKQVHGVEIQTVGPKTGLNVSDGLVTNICGLVLAVKIADCAAVLVYDPKNKAVGAFHSGWKGTMQNIVKTGIEKMQKLYSTLPADLLVYISPCASGAQYEVKWDVAQFFPDSVTQIAAGKYLFDNKKQINIQLTELGVKPENIETSAICTITDENYHSYRRDKENSGRMAAFIGMIE